MLTHPPLIEANPGDPITSEGWNNIIASLKTLFEAWNKPQGTVAVKALDKADNSPVKSAVVSLIRKDGTQARGAVFVGGAVQAYVAFGLQAGAYSLVLEAPNYSTETRDLEVLEQQAVQETTVPLTKVTVKANMPNLFGFTVNEAKAALTNAGLALARILDSHGMDVPPANVPAAVGLARVLNQVPEPGTLVAPSSPVQLHISAKVEVSPPVKVPKITGLAYAEAKLALEAAGLKIAAPITGSK